MNKSPLLSDEAPTLTAAPIAASSTLRGDTPAVEAILLVLRGWNQAAVQWANKEAFPLDEGTPLGEFKLPLPICQRVTCTPNGASTSFDFFTLHGPSKEALTLVPFFEKKLPLLASLAHDITNPLHATFSYLDAVLEGSQGGDAIDLLKKAQNATARALEMVRNYRTIEKLYEARAFSSWGVKTNLVERVRLALDGTYRPLSQGSEIVLRLPKNEECFTDAPRASVDQVIANLLSNCLKYTSPGGKILIEVAQEPAEVARLRFINTCKLIPKEELSRLTHCFVRGQQSEKIQGSGLGLFIVSKLLDRAGGTLNITSTEDKGICVDVSFPLSVTK